MSKVLCHNPLYMSHWCLRRVMVVATCPLPLRSTQCVPLSTPLPPPPSGTLLEECARVWVSGCSSKRHPVCHGVPHVPLSLAQVCYRCDGPPPPPPSPPHLHCYGRGRQSFTGLPAGWWVLASARPSVSTTAPPPNVHRHTPLPPIDIFLT